MAARSEVQINRARSIKGFEQKLSDAFKPVQPSGDFVQKLRQRLSRTAPLHMEYDQPTGWMWWILGLIFSVLGFYLIKRLWRYLNSGK